MIPDAAPVERFRADVERVLGRPVALGERLALAVSGGPDSMAMVALGTAAFPGQVIAATVDHGLRPESAAEAAMVAEWCASAGVEHATLPVEVPPGASGNLQSWARHQRYGLLRRWAWESGAAALCTAHHADDQAETFLMRATRGAGIAGLSGIRERQDVMFLAGPVRVADAAGAAGVIFENGGIVSVLLLRPLLDWRRAELRQMAVDEALPFVDDPSNADPRFRRTHLRAMLAERTELDAVQISRAARQLAAVNDDLSALSRWLWEQRASWTEEPSQLRIEVANLPREVRRRLTRMAVVAIESLEREVEPVEEHYADANLEPLLDALEAGKQAMQGDVLASATGTVWRFREAPPRRQ